MTAPGRDLEDRFENMERALAYEIEERKKLEAHLEQFEKQTQPVIDFYRASTLLGKFLWIVGGVVVGVTAIWATVSGWVGSHWK